MNNASDAIESGNAIPILSQEDVYQGCHAAMGKICLENCHGCAGK